MDITFKGIPDYITETELRDWVAVLISRKEQGRVEKSQAVIAEKQKAQVVVDTFVSANKVEPIIPITDDPIIKVIK